MTHREALDTEAMLQRLSDLLLQHRPADSMFSHDQSIDDAYSLRRISMTLHRWHELECGTDGGCIERDETTGRTYWLRSYDGKRYKTADREAGALKRLAAIMARYPSLTSYVQGDPRGCTLYILRPGDILEGSGPDACYSRGLAVHQ